MCLSVVKSESLKYVNGVCSPYFNDMKATKEVLNEMKDFKDQVAQGFKDLEDKLAVVKEEPGEANGVVGDVKEQAADSADPTLSWADVGGSRKRTTKRNLLVVKATESNEKATEKKNDISQDLAGVRISDARFTSGGNIVMKFEGGNVRYEAAKKNLRP